MRLFELIGVEEKMRDVRKRNLRRCAESTSGVTPLSVSETRRITLSLAPGTTLDGELVDLIQTEKVTIETVSAENGSIELELRVR